MTSTKTPGKHGGTGRWWVIHRHHEFDVVQREKRPETPRETGRRIARALGPFDTEEAARKKADEIKAKTWPARAGKEL